MADTVRVFVSYSHADVRYLGKNSLLGYLRGLEKENVTFWTDREIKPGELWDQGNRAMWGVDSGLIARVIGMG